VRPAPAESRIRKKSQAGRAGFEPRRVSSPHLQYLSDEEYSDREHEAMALKPASPSMGWYHYEKPSVSGWPSPPHTDTEMESLPCPSTPPSALDDDAGSLLDSSTRREVLDSLRWRLEAEKSVKIGEELQFLVLEQQHEITDLRAQLHDSHVINRVSARAEEQTNIDKEEKMEVVQLRKDLRQARRDNEALGRRAVAEEERADTNQRTVQVVEQEKRIAEQVWLYCVAFFMPAASVCLMPADV
jgi:hypothetical protein